MDIEKYSGVVVSIIEDATSSSKSGVRTDIDILNSEGTEIPFSKLGTVNKGIVVVGEQIEILGRTIYNKNGEAYPRINIPPDAEKVIWNGRNLKGRAKYWRCFSPEMAKRKREEDKEDIQDETNSHKRIKTD